MLPEAKVVNSIKVALKKEYPNIFIFKVHGGLYQEPGIPDLIACIRGHFVGIEVKTLNTMNTVTRLQQYQIDRINCAGGLAFVCCDAQDALNKVREIFVKS